MINIYLEVEHFWVEAYLPYGNYRGAGGDSSDKYWVPLDPSFKLYAEHAGRDLGAETNLDVQPMLNDVEAHATVNATDEWVSDIYSSRVDAHVESYQATVEAHLAGEPPDLKLKDITGWREIVKEEFGILPPTLPYDVVKDDPKKPVTRHDSMPDAMRHKIRIQLSYWPRGLAISDEEGGLGLMEIDYTSPLATLADKRITVSYEPARDVDRQMIASAGGNMENG